MRSTAMTSLDLALVSCSDTLGCAIRCDAWHKSDFHGALNYRRNIMIGEEIVRGPPPDFTISCRQYPPERHRSDALSYPEQQRVACSAAPADQAAVLPP